MSASSRASGGAAWQTPKATNSTSTSCPPRNTPRSSTQHSPARGSSTAVTVEACNPSTIPLMKAWLSPHTSSGAFAVSGWNGQLRSRRQVADSLSGSKPRSDSNGPARVRARSCAKLPRSGPAAFRGTNLLAALACHAFRRLRAFSPPSSLTTASSRLPGQHVVAALRDTHPDVGPGRLIHLGTTANPAHGLDWPVMRAERARVDQLVQVERGQLARDPDGRRGLITSHRTPGSADVLVHPPPQVIV